MADEKFFNACVAEDWDYAKSIIAEKPRLLWGAMDRHRRTVAMIAAGQGNVEMLRFIYKTIVGFQRLGRLQRTVLDVFRGKGCFRSNPMHFAASAGSIECIEFLMKHCPNGNNLFDTRNGAKETPAHCAAQNGQIEALKFMVKNAPRGWSILCDRDVRGVRPLDYPEVDKYENEHGFRPLVPQLNQ